jgi:N-acetylmuramoyl-L-alanine amidase.
MQLVQSYLTNNPFYQRNVNKVDGRYTTFQERGPLGGILHSVGCAQPSAQVFINNWNKPGYTTACVHGFIDANTGVVHQTLPWNFRGAHAGKAAGNDTMLGVEMCESKWIRYRTDKPWLFTVLDLEQAQADCRRTYEAAVELFAMLAGQWKWDPDRDIISHKEGGLRGVASGHTDPEHFWEGLSMPYTMKGFREDVKKAMRDQMSEIENQEGVLYCVQVGAFRRKDYAEAYLEDVRRHYPQAYITKK